MENSNINFEDEWRKAFKDAEEEPNEAIWQNIEVKLAEKDLLAYKKKYFYLRVAAAVLLLLFVPLSIYFIYHYQNEGLIAHKHAHENNIQEHIFLEESKSIANSSSNQQNSKSSLNPTFESSEETIESSDDDNTQGEIDNSYSKINKIRSGNLKENKVIKEFLTEVKTDNIATANSLNFKENNIATNNNYIGHFINETNNPDIVTNSSTVEKLSPKGTKQKTLGPKKIYLYFWQNENMFSQAELSAKKKKKQKTNRWYANLDFTPTYTDQNFKSENMLTSTTSNRIGMRFDEFSGRANSSLNNSTKELELMTTPQFSFASGMNGAYRINNNLSVEVGVKYVYAESKVSTNFLVQSSGSASQYPAFNVVLKDEEAVAASSNSFTNHDILEKASYSYLDKAIVVNNSSNPLDNSTYKSVNFYTEYVGIPLTLNYKLVDKKINILIGGGVSTDFFVKYGSRENKQEGIKGESFGSSESNFRPFGFSLLLTPEVEYEMSTRSSLYLRPTYKRALHSFTDSNYLSNKPNVAGIGFGLRYNLK